MSASKGAGLGIANAVVIAAAIAASGDQSGAGHRELFGVFGVVLVYGAVPAFVVGSALGLVAGWLRAPPALRALLLAIPAVMLVALLGSVFGLDEMILPSCVPTLACVAILERSTRPRGRALPPARTV